MKATDLKCDWPVWIFYAGLGLYLLSVPWYHAPGQELQLFNRIQYVMGLAARALLLLRLLAFVPVRPKYALVCFCLLGVLKLSSTLAVLGKSDLFHLAFVLLASRDSDIRVSLKIVLVSIVFFLIACPAFYALGWSGEVVKHIGQMKGTSLGFGNPNTFACFIMAAAYCSLCLARERRLPVICIVGCLAAALVWFLTLCKTISLCLLALPPLFALLGRWRNYKLVAALPVACLLLSLVLAAIYGPGYGGNTFESRFSIPALVCQKCGLSLFGQDCGLEHWFMGEAPFRLNIDNCYLNIFLCNGIVPGLLAIAFLTYLMLLIARKGDPLLVAISCIMAVSGIMESWVFVIYLNFLPLFFFPLLDQTSPVAKWAGISSAAAAVAAAIYVFMPFPPHHGRQAVNGVVGDIPAPDGFVKAGGDQGGFPAFLAALPLAGADSAVTRFDGRPADSLQYCCYRVVDYPLIDNSEQCADVCMRLWAEYLYDRGRFGKIRFTDTRGRRLKYRFGACRPLFERYLREVYTWCNTGSLRESLSTRQIGDIAAGDVFVFDADSRPGEIYGHAVMVADVAVDYSSGRRAVLLLQGSTPACDIHILSNPSGISPWFLLDDSGEDVAAPVIIAGKSVFYASELFGFE